MGALMHLGRRLHNAFVVTALTATALVGLSSGTASAAACSSSLHPSVRGGEADWFVVCNTNGTVWARGWVKDTLANGKCASVRFVWPDGYIYYSPRACGYGTKVNFDTPKHKGSSLNGYLIVT